MNVKIGKGPLNNGQVRIISSKSDGHRSLIAAALAEEESVLFVDGWSDDMEATRPFREYRKRKGILLSFVALPRYH